jgi:hypothetical protein
MNRQDTKSNFEMKSADKIEESRTKQNPNNEAPEAKRQH